MSSSNVVRIEKNQNGDIPLSKLLIKSNDKSSGRCPISLSENIDTSWSLRDKWGKRIIKLCQ